jgi:squalene-associated FAD-dependent desaturase
MSGQERPHVAIIGGGVAGICAALACASSGARTTLLEVRPRLGGAAYSIEREGLILDNGQHVFLRRCDAYRALLRRLGSEHLVEMQDRLEIPVLRAGSAPTVLRRSSLPAPAHLARAMLTFAPLAPRKRISAAAAVRALAGVDPNDRRNDEVAFGEWLAARGQSEESVAALWDLVVLPTLNLRSAEASLALAAFVFQEGLLHSTSAGDIGFHRGSLSAIIGDPALVTLRDAGVEVRLRWRVEHVGQHADGMQVEGSSGGRLERLRCDAAIVALPHQRAAELLPDELEALARRLRRIGVSPIVNLHVLYDRRVCELPFAAALHSAVQYLFDRTEAGGAPPGHQYLAVSLSGADEEMGMSVSELRGRYLPALAALLPAARRAAVKRFLVTREHAATFRAAPGVAALRPPPATGLRGLALAGAYTDTGWPATLEGAARSGNAAAETVLRELADTVPVSQAASVGGWR